MVPPHRSFQYRSRSHIIIIKLTLPTAARWWIRMESWLRGSDRVPEGVATAANQGLCIAKINAEPNSSIFHQLSQNMSLSARWDLRTEFVFLFFSSLELFWVTWTALQFFWGLHLVRVFGQIDKGTLLIQFNLNVSSSGRQEQHNSNNKPQSAFSSRRSVPGSPHGIKNFWFAFHSFYYFCGGVSNLSANVQIPRFSSRSAATPQSYTRPQSHTRPSHMFDLIWFSAFLA